MPDAARPGGTPSRALRSAGGTAVRGRLHRHRRAHAGDRLEVAVVDVSGKGEQAGTRALLLSGAFGGLLGALPPAEFLPAANDYLLRQDWAEGFATAVHLSLDLTPAPSSCAPPGTRRPSSSAGSGRWTMRGDRRSGARADRGRRRSRVVSGVLRRGDAVLLYTDGMVETPSRDIDLGIDRMLGQAERLLRGDFTGGRGRLVDGLGSRDDDRALCW